ncbi:Sperm-associated antigen 4 protein [Orchesella cincta]|uniref:Sperm-associated antigen 4 protein n=1 Tax=Orchesella cincta TaxID=48709 RepID=A0A1D2MPK0_ORCCI|nr:Sperm-associated antigen 4 protein [Orchesella cincta]
MAICWQHCTIICGVLAVLLVVFMGFFGEGPDDDDCDNSDGDCSSDPWSGDSCCKLNPVIDKQVRELQSGYCNCIVNIGSLYLGASVASIRETITYNHPQGRAGSAQTNRPELVLEPAKIIVGRNWHFTGDNGTLVVKLFYPSQISGFTIIHPPPCQLPSGHEVSAPKDFYVKGLEQLDEQEPVVFGNFTYIMGRSSIQHFPVQFCSKVKYQFVEFQFTSNHGNPNYTSLYKVQIHGDSGVPLVLSDGDEGETDKDSQPDSA